MGLDPAEVDELEREVESMSRLHEVYDLAQLELTPLQEQLLAAAQGIQRAEPEDKAKPFSCWGRPARRIVAAPPTPTRTPACEPESKPDLIPDPTLIPEPTRPFAPSE